MPFQTHPKFFHKLEPDVNLYRYLTFEKFISMIERSALFFCKASVFSDNWEGSYPIGELKYKKEESYWIEKELNKTSEQKIDTVVSDNLKYLNAGYENFKDKTFINCWMHSTHESDAMWKLYVGKQEGILVKSSYERLYNALNQNLDLNFMMSRVFYIDYDKDYLYKGVEKFYEISKEMQMHLESACITDPFLNKRIHFEHEKEYRVILDIPPPEHIKREGNGIFASISLNTLIEEIILPPNCSDDFEIKIKSVLNEFNISKKLSRSKMEGKPYSFLNI